MRPLPCCLAAICLVAACGAPIDDPQTFDLANPAAEFCAENGGTYTTVDADGSAVCTLASGESVDAWAFFRENTPQEG